MCASLYSPKSIIALPTTFGHFRRLYRNLPDIFSGTKTRKMSVIVRLSERSRMNSSRFPPIFCLLSKSLTLKCIGRIHKAHHRLDASPPNTQWKGSGATLSSTNNTFLLAEWYCRVFELIIYMIGNRIKKFLPAIFYGVLLLARLSTGEYPCKFCTMLRRPRRRIRCLCGVGATVKRERE